MFNSCLLKFGICINPRSSEQRNEGKDWNQAFIILTAQVKGCPEVAREVGVGGWGWVWKVESSVTCEDYLRDDRDLSVNTEDYKDKPICSTRSQEGRGVGQLECSPGLGHQESHSHRHCPSISAQDRGGHPHGKTKGRHVCRPYLQEYCSFSSSGSTGVYASRVLSGLPR